MKIYKVAVIDKINDDEIISHELIERDELPSYIDEITNSLNDVDILIIDRGEKINRD